MNWRVSFLDRYRLTSNSDAHSRASSGGRATTFDCELDYFAIEHALRTGHGYIGTVEFFPDEGKYPSTAIASNARSGSRPGDACPSRPLPVCGEP